MYIQRIRRDHLKQKPITGVGFTAERFNLIILLTICILPQEIPRWPTHQAHDVQQRELFSQTHQHWKSILKSTKVTSRCTSCSGAQQWVCSQKLCMRPLTNSSQTGASVLAAKFHIGFQIIQQTVASNYKTEKQQRPEMKTINTIMWSHSTFAQAKNKKRMKALSLRTLLGLRCSRSTSPLQKQYLKDVAVDLPSHMTGVT